MIPINKKNIFLCILFSLLTFGIYGIHWQLLLIENTKAINKNDSSGIKELVLMLFVPFYSLYWWFTRGNIIKEQFEKHGYKSHANAFVYLLLGLFGLYLISMSLMQYDFNSLTTVSQPNVLAIEELDN